MEYRIAIVEDNANARTTLRSHMLPLGIFDVSSFASGAELRAALRRQNFEIIVMDYHLGQGKTGAEWIRNLKDAGYIRPSTGLIFITSDRLPQTIGRIFDIHPDVLLIKPYTIATLVRYIEHYLIYRSFVSDVLRAMDEGDNVRALRTISRLINDPVPQRLQSDITKLHARLLLESGHTQKALACYEEVLERSERVLWAQWGRIQCYYNMGKWSSCKSTLDELISNNLARNKAYEWLASLSFEDNAYKQAEDYLDHIKFSELSVPATRLKTLVYQNQEKTLDAIELLQKKRDVTRSAKEQFDEFTFELANFYLLLAEQSPETNRKESLKQARRMIGIAGRNQSDTTLIAKRDCMLAYSSILDNDLERAKELLQSVNTDNLMTRAEPALLILAAKAFHAIDDVDTATAFIDLVANGKRKSATLAENVINQRLFLKSVKDMGMEEVQANSYNEVGLIKFSQQQFEAAMDLFYTAFELCEDTAAYGLNLLQCMIESKTPSYRKYDIEGLIVKLHTYPMSELNQKRFGLLSSRAILSQGKDYGDETVSVSPP